jgi:predicted O-linked N-acetylglucosamine transferase (SPINDLY family)
MSIDAIPQTFARALQLHQEGRLGEAEALYRQVLSLDPRHPVAFHFLGVLALQTSRYDLAIRLIGHALALDANDPTAHSNLGEAYRALGLWEEAVASYRRALRIQPIYPDAHYNLGNALLEGGQVYEAASAYRRALEIQPSHAEAHNNLGTILKSIGDLDGSLAAYRRAITCKPGYSEAHSNLLYASLFHPDLDPAISARDHDRWNHQFAEPLRGDQKPHANSPDPERRLRIGYVSPDFKRHPISHFITPLLEAHDPSLVEVYCYASVPRPDDFTNRLKRKVHLWRDVVHLGDDALAECIWADQIDILVDLSQHMAGNRLLMFARKPAPIQVAWLGYPASTGLPAMDYRLTDDLIDPEDSPWSHSVETPVRLPDAWFCFDPLESPEITPLPALATGQVTFGSLNNFSKVNPGVLHLWMSVLRANPSSRLLLHCPPGATHTQLRQWFETQGLASHRLALVPRTATRMEYLDLYRQIDIGLDTFPYNGGTTTCDALWMGVPTVSLAGKSGVSRLGLSTLTHAGLPALVTSSEADYVDIATRLAQDLPSLAELRSTLRALLQASPLMDGPRFAHHFENAYRKMWRNWCANSA